MFFSFSPRELFPLERTTGFFLTFAMSLYARVGTNTMHACSKLIQRTHFYFLISLKRLNCESFALNLQYVKTPVVLCERVQGQETDDPVSQWRMATCLKDVSAKVPPPSDRKALAAAAQTSPSSSIAGKVSSLPPLGPLTVSRCDPRLSVDCSCLLGFRSLCSPYSRESLGSGVPVPPADPFR
jgi:hypothetical protein